MNIVEKIKAQQIAEAEERGEENPYSNPAGAPVVASDKLKRQSVVEKIKAKQLEETPDLYQQSEKTIQVVGAGVNNLFEQLQAAMVTDIARIKTVKKLEEKQAIKRELLPAYLPFVDDYMANGHDYPCDVAVRVMIWRFDIGDIEQGLSLGLYLVAKGNQTLPFNSNRDIETFISDEMCEWANTQLKNEQSASPYLEELITEFTVQKWDMHPLVISKNLAMMAKHRLREGDLHECVALCQRAEEANPKGAGVKTMKEKALKEIKKQKENTGVAKYIKENT